MIVVADLSYPVMARLFSAIGSLHRRCEFRVIDPQFIGFFKNDESIEDRLISGVSGTAYALSCEEIVDMLQEGHLGFDWTDVVVVAPSEGQLEARTIAYVQCIDAGLVYVVSEDKLIVEHLLSDGFSRYHSSSLPHAAHEFPDLI